MVKLAASVAAAGMGGVRVLAARGLRGVGPPVASRAPVPDGDASVSGSLVLGVHCLRRWEQRVHFVHGSERAKRDHPAVPSDLACAGGGPDAANSGCFQLHRAYGLVPSALAAVAGRGPSGRGTAVLADACGEAGVIKVFGDAAGLATLVAWKALPASKTDSSWRPASASECQAKCAADAACQFFTFNDQSLSGGAYAYYRGLCFMHEALTCNGPAYSQQHGAISGPRNCSRACAARQRHDATPWQS
uniref:Apple domain-containing protein n=1 Tax=Alexandrium monilatum TaxID=311494 RepID=A0A7S4S2Z7_9DINO